MNLIFTSLKTIGLPSLFLLGYLISPFDYGFVFGYLLFAYFLTSGSLIIKLMDSHVIVLGMFTVIYSIFYTFNPISGTQFIFIYLLFPPLFYLLGKLIAQKLKDFENIYSFIVFLAVSYSIVALISVLYNIYTKGFVVVNRNISMIWSDDIMNATGMAAYLFANMCIPALLLFSFRKNSLPKNIFLILIYLLSIAATLRLGSRTQLVISASALVTGLVFFISRQNIVGKFKTLLISIVIISGIISYTSVDLESDTFSSYSGRIESKRYGAASAGGRTGQWEKSIINLYEKPLGWDVDDFGLSHNLWLDAARVGTVIGFVFLILFSFKSARITYKFIASKTVYNPLRNLVLVYFVSFYLQFFVEPILDGSIQLFVFYCLFQGIVNETHFINNSNITPLIINPPVKTMNHLK